MKNIPDDIPYDNPNNPCKIAARSWIESGKISQEQDRELRKIKEGEDDRSSRLAAVLLALCQPKPNPEWESDPITQSLKLQRNRFRIKALKKAGKEATRQLHLENPGNPSPFPPTPAGTLSRPRRDKNYLIYE